MSIETEMAMIAKTMTGPTTSTGINERHGGPFDRGHSDAYYGRPIDPHYYLGASYDSRRIDVHEMTDTERSEYLVGYVTCTEKKQW